MERRKRRSFMVEFKTEAVRLVREGTKTLPLLAKDLDLTESALRQWVHQAEQAEGKGAAGALAQPEREELVRLRKENRQLLMERDFPRKGNCWDNAVVESFFCSLKMELVYPTQFATRQQARSAIFEYIEVFYNRRRRHSTLGYLSPVEYEQAALPATLAA